jgi:hypothetical protein
MDDDLNPSPASEVSSNQKAAANDSNKKSEPQPKQEAQPRQRKVRKWFGLSKMERRELAGILVLIPWVWVDFIDCHNLKKLCLLAFSLAIAQLFFFSFWKPRWLAIALGLLSLIPVTGVVYKNSKPEMRLYELLPPDVVTNLIQKLKDSHNHNVAIVIHAFEPDESAFSFSEQLERIFIDGGYPIFSSQPPVSIAEIPGVSCFLYSGANADNAGLLEALGIIIDKSHSPLFRIKIMSPSAEADPWFTNSIVFISIRKK